MKSEGLSGDLRRFIQTIPSVPHLEAILLVRQAPAEIWGVDSFAKRLYVTTDQARQMLNDLCASGVCIADPADANKVRYAPAADGFDEILSQLGHYYAHNLIEVTNMIHAKSNSPGRAQLFADAFKFLKDK